MTANNLLSKGLIFLEGIILLVGVTSTISDYADDINSTRLRLICIIDFILVLCLILLLKDIQFLNRIPFMKKLMSLKKKINPHAIKYIIICTVCLLTMSVVVIPNTRIYLTFLLPPLLSFFYLNQSFTLFACILSGSCYVLSIGIRCLYEEEMFAVWTRKSYFLAFGIGGLVEYSYYCLILLFLIWTTTKLLKHTYLRKKRLIDVHNLILEGFANIVESKDSNTAEHISRTSSYVELICQQLKKKGIYPEEVNDRTIPVMIRAAPFHDLGKVNVPDDILNKPGKLNSKEWNRIHYHPADGALFIQHNFQVLNDEFFVQTAAEMALCHHERMDGTGYPFRLIGEEIPVSARIMATADIFDALVSNRAYKKAFSIDEAYALLKDISGTALDPVMVDCMIDARKDVEQILGVISA